MFSYKKIIYVFFTELSKKKLGLYSFTLFAILSGFFSVTLIFVCHFKIRIINRKEMGFKIIDKALNGLVLIKPDVFSDERGFFMESFRKNFLEDLGIKEDFIQENHSKSSKDVLRGMHFQWDPPQGKLIRVTAGSAFVAEVDIRKESESFGKYYTCVLSSENKMMLWVPAGFANGFLVLSDICEMQYKCTAYWNKDSEGSLMWNDPDIDIPWPQKNPILSDKDKIAKSLVEWTKSKVPYFNVE